MCSVVDKADRGELCSIDEPVSVVWLSAQANVIECDGTSSRSCICATSRHGGGMVEVHGELARGR